MAELRIRDVPEAVRRALKMRAAAEGKSLNQVVIEVLSAAVKGKERKG